MDATAALSRAVEEQRERLLPCVHCGFCLPACPTYDRLGDEADSPRGRLHLMRAVVEGRMDPASDAFRTHIDRCLGCRACEPVCPSGVEYGSLLELARDTAARHRSQDVPTRLLLGTFRSPLARAWFFFKGRLLRDTGLAALLSRLLPRRGLLGSARLALAMLAATSRFRRLRRVGAGGREGPEDAAPRPAPPPELLRVGLLTGCVQEGLYGRVNAATRRVLEANGFQVVEVGGQDCCGALHAHGGALDGARALARRNVDAFLAAGADAVVVNAAGCGATMKEYADLLAHDGEYAARAGELGGRIRDAGELLATVGPRPGAPVRASVAWDHPCHLVHGQGLEAEPLAVLAAVPGLEVRVVENARECCGGAGIYGITHPELGGEIGGDKVAAVRRVGADMVATPNPGCMMQIGAGLRLEGDATPVLHPLEILDESYRRAGYYGGAT